MHNLTKTCKNAALSSSYLLFYSKHISTTPLPSQDQIAHLILDQKSPSQALQTFNWASNLPNFTHSQSTYRALIHKLCTFRRFDSIPQLLDEMSERIGCNPDDDIFITIVRGLGRARMVRRLLRVPDLVGKFNKEVSLKLHNSILDVIVKEDIDLARYYYRKKMMRCGVNGDDYTYGILMKGLYLTNRIGDGFKLLQIMKSSGVNPNVVVYNTLLHGLCKNGKVGRARSLMSEMDEPNDVTFNILISGYCKEDNLAQALVLLEKSFALGFVPDVVTVTKILELLCDAGRVNEAVEVLERVENRGGAVDVVAFNTLIKGFCKTGKVKIGARYMKMMEQKGCLPNVDTYNILISGFCGSGMLESALDVFNEMKDDGVAWNFDTFDTLIRGLFSGGRLEDGFKILELMEDSKGGSGSRISPYNSVLYGFYKKNMWDEALGFLLKMENLFPRGVDSSLKILEFCENGAIEDAKRVYGKMTDEVGTPSVLVYDCLIHVFCQEGRMRDAFEVMNDMVGHDYLPVTSAFNALIAGFCKQGNDVNALKILEDMNQRRCIPDIGSYRPLVNVLCRKGNFQKALNLLLQMLEKSINPDYSIWSSLILCLSQQNIWLENKKLLCLHNLVDSIIET